MLFFSPTNGYRIRNRNPPASHGSHSLLAVYCFWVSSKMCLSHSKVSEMLTPSFHSPSAPCRNTEGCGHLRFFLGHLVVDILKRKLRRTLRTLPRKAHRTPPFIHPVFCPLLRSRGWKEAGSSEPLCPSLYPAPIVVTWCCQPQALHSKSTTDRDH